MTPAQAVLCLFLLLFSSSSVLSQAAAPQTAPPAATITTRTELVLVPAIVSDHHGAHIPGLTQDDFTVLENGVEQKIASFEEVKPTAAPVQQLTATTPPMQFTNMRPANFQPRRVNIIVLDSLNTPFSDQAYARQQLIRYLRESVKPDDLITLLVFTRGGVKVIHDFTTNTRVLVAALHRTKGQAGPMEGQDANTIAMDPMSRANSFDQQVQATADRFDDQMAHMEAVMTRLDLEYTIHATLDCFENIANAYGGIPGRKALIWITSSFPFMFDKPGDTATSAFQARRDHLFEMLNSANIAVYPVDARGLVSGAVPANRVIPSSTMRRGGAGLASMQRTMTQTHEDTLTTLTEVAAKTGGRAYYNTNDLAHAIENADTDSSAYYLLGYYVKTAEGKPGWRKLAVKVKRSGVQVRARSGYYANRDHLPDDVRRQEIIDALSSPFESTGVPIVMRWMGQSPTEGAKRAVDFHLQLDGRGVTVDESDGNRISLDFIAVARTPELQSAGEISQQFGGKLPADALARVRSTGMGYHNQLYLAPGEYTVRFIVRDNLNGRIGSVTAPLKVQ